MESIKTHSYLASVNLETRKDFIQKNSQEFHIPIEGKYRGTEKQNTALLKFLKTNDTFRQKWENELLKMGKEKVQEKKSILEYIGEGLSALKTQVLGNIIKNDVGKGIPTKVSDASVYHEGEDNWGGKTALGDTLRYSASNEGMTSCAANWGKFPPGTILRVDGKKYIVEDYGGFVKQHPNRIDRYLPKRIYKSQLSLNPKVEVLQWGDFKQAVKILETRRPDKYKYIAMMLEQAREKV